MARPPKQRSSPRGGPEQGRRKPPPEATGQERRFFNAQLKSGDRIGIQLIDGTRSEGVVRSYDEEQLVLAIDDQPSIVLRKSQIRYIEQL